jgi:hypothetical protein
MPAPALRARIAQKRDAASTARNDVPRAVCFIWPPASRRDRHRDDWYLWLSRSALPCITHENNDASAIESFHDDLHRRTHLFLMQHPATGIHAGSHLSDEVFSKREVAARELRAPRMLATRHPAAQGASSLF